MNKQMFEDATSSGDYDAVLTSTYDVIDRDVHRATYVNTARSLSKEWGLPGFWRVKQVAK